MNAIVKNEIAILGTPKQSKDLRASSWFVPSKHVIVANDSDFEHLVKSSNFSKNPVFVALSKSIFNHFMKYLVKNISNAEVVDSFHRAKPSFISFLDSNDSEENIVLNDLFEDVVLDNNKSFVLLNKEELLTVLAMPLSERRDQVIGLQVLESLKKVKILKADFETLFIPMDIFKATSRGVKADFKNIEIMEYGHYIKLGEYEASVSGILYECDKNYRLRRKKERFDNEISFGACLRRYRIQKDIKQSDFKNTSEITIRRIEAGKEPPKSRIDKILKELSLTEDELMSY
jgi:hypothetical protein